MDVHQRLEQIFRDVFNDESLVLSNDTTSSDIAAWDSVAHVNLMFAIESSFGIQFAGNELAEFENVGELKRYLEAQSRA
jgi:acyl carrier protein